MSKPATKFGSFFQTITLADGSGRVTFTDEIPEWLKDACREAMRNDMTDWLYETCESICDAFDRGDLTTDCDSLNEFADNNVEVYTKALFQWATDHCLTNTFAEATERANDLGAAAEATIEDRLKTVQYCAIDAMAQTLLNAIDENTKDADLDAEVN